MLPRGFLVVCLLGVACCVFLFNMPVAAAPGDNGESTMQSTAPIGEANGQQDLSSYALFFQGNVFFSEKQLRDAAKNELASFRRSGWRKAYIDDAAFLMEQAYKKAGFAFASVEYEFMPAKRQVTLRINEGPRVVLGDIVFSGNSFFKTSRLQQFFQVEQNHLTLLNSNKLFYIETDVKNAISSIGDLYSSEGYLDAEIRSAKPKFSEDKSSALLAIEINEGPRYIIKKIEFTGDVLAEAENELRSLAAALEGQPYFARRKLIIRSRILDIYGNLGYPDVEVEIDKGAGEKTGEVVLAAVISSGTRVIISGIVTSGNQKTKTSFIESRLTLRTGDYYSHVKKRESFHALYKTGLFSKVDLKLEETEEPNRRILAVRVEETLSRELSFEAGWGSYELLRLGFGYRDRNFLGTGRIIRTEELLSLKGESALVGVTDPWFFGTDVVADLPFSYRRRKEPSFTQQDTGASLLFSRELSKSILATLGYSFRFTTIKDRDLISVTEITDTDYNLASLKIQVTWDTRNDPFFPTAGYKHFVSAETADEIIGSEINLVRFTVGTRYFLALTRLLTLGIRYSTGFVLPTRNQVTLPLGERFYNGGENTVRSFKESQLGPLDLNDEAVGGMAFNVANIELRRRFSSNLAFTVFTDVGNISPNLSRAEEGKPAYMDRSEVIDTTFKQYFQDFRLAIGVGLQYLLPVGPLRLDFAWNPDRRPERGEDRYEIHFSVGMAF